MPPDPADMGIDPPAVTGAPLGDDQREAITGDDAASGTGGASYPESTSPDRGSSAPRG